MELNLGQVIATIINFLILLLILRYFLWDKLKSIIAEREKQINDKVMEVNKNLEDSESMKMKAKEILKEARLEGKKITEKRKMQADEIYTEIVDDARTSAEFLKENAKKEIVKEKEKVEHQLKLESVDLAVLLSKEILEKELTKDVQKDLIDKFIEGLEVKNV